MAAWDSSRIPADLRRIVEDEPLPVVWVGHGQSRAWTDYGAYQSEKLGHVSHIPVAATLEALDSYFTSRTVFDARGNVVGGAAGGTHAGIGREAVADVVVFGRRVQVARISQYYAIVGTGVAPWAQGVVGWQDNPRCTTTVHPRLRSLPAWVANPGFVSTEFVALEGSWGVADPQFNSGAIWMAYLGCGFGWPFDLDHFFGHCQFDPFDRCFDPGWTDFPWGVHLEMVEAAAGLARGDAGLLRPSEEVDMAYLDETITFLGQPVTVKRLTGDLTWVDHQPTRREWLDLAATGLMITVDYYNTLQRLGALDQFTRDVEGRLQGLGVRLDQVAGAVRQGGLQPGQTVRLVPVE